MLTYEITAGDHCRRAESFLANLLPAATLGYIRKLLKSGHARVNGGEASTDTFLFLGDLVALKESTRTAEFLRGAPPLLDLLYEDDHIVVVNKPGGLAMHRSAEDESNNLVELGRRFFRERGIDCLPRPVNRLDRGTSGAVIMAKSSTAAGMFGRFIKEEGLSKVYLALAEGRLADEGTMTEPLEGKDSETRFRLLAQGERCALVALFPVTGRTHQIRRHLTLAGHPIPGDRRYGGGALPAFPGIPLHSFRTTLLHPESAKSLTVCAPLPTAFLALAVKETGASETEILRKAAELVTS